MPMQQKSSVISGKFYEQKGVKMKKKKYEEDW